jgi:hypothetical protein
MLNLKMKVMKTIKLVFTVMALAVATITTAVEKPKVSVTPITADRAVVSILNENPAVFEMSIEDKTGAIVYYKQTNNSITDYRKVYDFAGLEAGEYVFNLKVNDTKVSNNFEVSDNGIVVGESKMRFAPYFNYEEKEGVLQLSYLNFDKEPLKLNFYNENGLVYKTELGKDFNIVTGYDLSKLEKGNYRVVLTSYSNEYAYDLVK